MVLLTVATNLGWIGSIQDPIRAITTCLFATCHVFISYGLLDRLKRELETTKKKSKIARSETHADKDLEAGPSVALSSLGE